jgi:hypothetical protein
MGKKWKNKPRPPMAKKQVDDLICYCPDCEAVHTIIFLDEVKFPARYKIMHKPVPQKYFDDLRVQCVCFNIRTFKEAKADHKEFLSRDARNRIAMGASE